VTAPRTCKLGRAGVLLALLLMVAVAGTFRPILDNGYVWDDKQYIQNNRHVTGGVTGENLRWAFTSFEAGNWHPLTWVSHMLDAEVFGPGPRGPHLVNLLLHGANSVLLLALLLRMTGALWRSFLVAALFAVHPLHVESVAWAAERKDLLSACLGLLAICAYLRHASRPGRLQALAVLLLFAAGLAAKPMLVTLPCLLLLLDFWPLGRLTACAWRRALLEKVPLLLLVAASCAVTIAAQASAGALSSYDLAARVSNALVSYARYLVDAVAPCSLAAFYPHPERSWPLWQTLGAGLLLALGTLFVLVQHRRRPFLATGWFWYLGTLVPVIGLLQVGQQARADRYTYLPLTGVFLMVAWGAGELALRRPRWRAPLIVAAAAALIAFSVASSVLATSWKDTVSLFSRAARKAPGNWMAHYNLGVHYQESGQPDAAIEHYRAAIAARGDYDKALNNLGVLVAARGDSAAAMAYYRTAIEASPGYAEAYHNLGAELVKQLRPAEAEIQFRQALRLEPASLETHLNLAALLARQRRWVEAAAEYAAALQIGRDSAVARNGLGVCLAGQARFEEALVQFREALRIDPGNADAQKNSARALALLGRR